MADKITNFTASVLIRGEFESLPIRSYRGCFLDQAHCYNYFAANSERYFMTI